MNEMIAVAKSYRKKFEIKLMKLDDVVGMLERCNPGGYSENEKAQLRKDIVNPKSFYIEAGGAKYRMLKVY